MALDPLASPREGATLLIVGAEALEPLPTDTLTLDQLALVVAGSPTVESDLQARSRLAEILAHFKAPSDPEQVAAIFALFELWWEQGATADELLRTTSATAIAGQMQVLVEVRTALEGQLALDGRAVRAALADLATKALLTAGPPALLRRYERLEVRNVRWLSPAQRKFISALASALAPKPQVTWCWPAFDAPAADALTIDAVQAFESEGEASAFELRRELVSQHWSPYAAAALGGPPASAVPDGRLRIVSVGTPAAEARFIASELRDLIDNGAEVASLGVAFRRCAPEELELLRDACARVVVPLASNVGTQLIEAQAMRAALLPFAVLESPVPEHRLLRLLASPYCRLLDRSDIPLARRLSSVEFDASRIGRFAKHGNAASLNAVCKKALADLKTLPEQGTAAEHLAAWAKVRSALNFQFVLNEDAPAARLAEPLARIAHEERAAVAAFEKLTHVLAAGKARMSRREFARLVRLEAERIALPPFPGEGVFVGKVGALAPKAFSTLFLAGMTEEWLNEQSRPYFLAEELTELKPLARRMLFRTHVRPDGENMSFREAAARSEFCTAFGAAPHLVCTWPRKDKREEDTKMLRYLELLTAAAVEYLPHTPPAAPAPDEDWLTAYAEREQFFEIDEAPPGPYSGATGLHLREELDFPQERALSATTMGRWGNCGFQGFWRNVARLSEERTVGDALDPMEQGSVVHGVLAKVAPDTWSKESLRAAVEDEVPYDLHADLRSLEVERIFRQVLLVMEAYPRPFPNAQPVASEHDFGGKGNEVELTGLTADEPSVFLKGRIDRIDRGEDFVGAVDYKSSGKSVPDYRRAILTSDFQLPFYLLALKGPARSDAAWVNLQDSSFTLLSRVLSGKAKNAKGDDSEFIDTLLAVDAVSRKAAAAEEKPNLANAVHSILAKLRRGEFPPRSESCRYCEYSGLCRREVGEEW